MLFPTFTFFAFLIPVLVLNWLLKRWPLAWRIYLLAVSYFFYATWSWRFLLVLVALTLATYAAAKKIEHGKNARLWLVLGIVINLAALFIFKYYDFFRVSFETAMGGFGLTASWPVLQLLLPIGLSFYALRAISYLVDLRKGNTAQASLLDFAVYLAFFPQLLSGPIARPDEFLPQLRSGGATDSTSSPQADIPEFHLNFARIIMGLFKKLVLSSYFMTLADAVFAAPGSHSALTILLGLYAYAIVIYADFSGYTDMATGIAGLMGFTSPLNFAMPYKALSIQDFWRRWHVSFSRWLQDYVYFPLGGSRVGALRRSFNLMATMLVSGLWHGAGLNYLVWGALHGLALLLHRLWKDIRNRVGALQKIRASWLAWLLTFHFTVFAWIFFRSATFGEAMAVFRGLLAHEAVAGGVGMGFFFALLLAFAFLAKENWLTEQYAKIQERLPLVGQVALLTTISILIIELGPDIVPPFIYFQF